MEKAAIALTALLLTNCAHPRRVTCRSDPQPKQTGYLKVNGTEIYYEAEGQGDPLVLLHGGGSDMHVSFGKGLKTLQEHYRVIAFDEQGHGKSPVTERPFGFENTAKDIAEALKQLKIKKANFIGFSNGATTGMYLAIQNPELFTKMILGSGLYSRAGAPKEFWAMMKAATLDSMPSELKEAYKKSSPHPENLVKMFEYDSKRMQNFKDIPEKQIKSVQIPILIMQTDQDVATLEHGVHTTRLLPKGRFAALPGPHDNFIGDVSKDSPRLKEASLNIMLEFLKEN